MAKIRFLLNLILNSSLATMALGGFSTLALAYTLPANTALSAQACTAFIKTIEKDFHYGWVQSNAVVKSIYPSNATTEKMMQKFNEPVNIFYYHSKAAVKTPWANPILFLNGGPHFSSQGSYNYVMAAAKKFGFAEKTDFIFMDQRGTGCSTASPLGDSMETIGALKSWGSIGIVHDAEQVRKKLIGSKKWKIFGQSFGAFIGYRYLELFPESLKSAHLHGNAIGLSEGDRSYFRIRSQVQNFNLFVKKFPAAGKKLKILNTYLSDSHRCFKTSSSQVCGHELTTKINYVLGFATGWSHLAQAIDPLVRDGQVIPSSVEKFVLTKLDDYSFNYKFKLSGFMINAKSDLLPFVSGIYDADSNSWDQKMCQKIYDRIVQQDKLSRPEIIFNECEAPVQFNYNNRLPEYLKVAHPTLTPTLLNVDKVKANLQAQKISVISYSGQLDSLVPVETFNAQQTIFGSLIQHTLFPQSGHEGFFTEKQIYIDLSK